MKNITKIFNNFSGGLRMKNIQGYKFYNINLLNNISIFSGSFIKYKIYKQFSAKQNESEQIYKNSTIEQENQNSKNEEIFNQFNEEFDKSLSSNEPDQEKRVRLLSIKLLQINSSREIINLFEEKYLKGLVNNIFGEEMSLIFYFYVSLLDKEVRDVASLDNNSSRVYIDKRFEKIVKLLNSKIEELDITNLIALSWSTSLLISKFAYNISNQFKKNIIKSLPQQLQIEKKGEIPTICFSISSYISEDEDLNLLIKDRISFSDQGLSYISPLNLSLLCISWTKIKLNDVDVLDSLSSSLQELQENFNEENLEEVCKIIWACFMLNYKNEKINQFLLKYLESNYDKITINYALDLFISFSSLNSDYAEVLEILIDLIIKNANDMNMLLDINSFVNLWLGLSKYYLKGGEKSIEAVSHMIKFLLYQYEKRTYLATGNMTLDELCSLLVCFSVLDMEPNKIYSDLGTSIKNNMLKFDNIQLIQLISCGKYLFNTKKHSDLYFTIHDTCISTKSSFDSNQLKTLKRILTNDGIILESIFLASKK